MHKPLLIVGVLAAVAGSAAPARAQVFLSGTLGGARSGVITNTALTYSGDFGYWTEGFLGLEADYSYSAKTRGGGLGDNDRTIMLDILAGPRLRDGNLRPYVTAGVGLVGPVATFSDIFAVHDNNGLSELGMNAGGGLMGSFNAHWGFRIDGRYLTNFKTPAGATERPYYLRAGAGLTLRF
jgi:hypothetical protein